jgi:carboxymethylenebutenolidase
MRTVAIETRDGLCPSYVFRPAAGGAWPAVLVFMDPLGIRPAVLELGERLASYGYYVLLPDLLYRSGPYPPMNLHAVFADPEQRKTLTQNFFAPATAGTYPDGIVAIASYHGGRLATDASDSPHLLAPKISWRVYIARAIDDPCFPDEMKDRLERALSAADVDHRIETFTATHGWVFRDTPVYDANPIGRACLRYSTAR